MISVNDLRQRMIDELTLTGMASRSQQTYLNAVDRLAARSWKSIEDSKLIHTTNNELRLFASLADVKNRVGLSAVGGLIPLYDLKCKISEVREVRY